MCGLFILSRFFLRNIISIVRSSLENLIMAIEGTVVMTVDLLEDSNCVFDADQNGLVLAGRVVLPYNNGDMMGIYVSNSYIGCYYVAF